MPAELASVALVTAKIAAAAGSVSLSWWYEKVASGEAPQPVIRGPRFTRWRLSDVLTFWGGCAERGTGTEIVQQVEARATKARVAAQLKRRAAD
jgi:predicted DNA-binding transcriptional regulator AlpA